MNVDGLGCHEPVLVHQPDAVVVGRAPDTGVGGHGKPELTSGLEGCLLREAGVTGHVEGLGSRAVPRRRCGGARRRSGPPCRWPTPPRAGLDVAVGEDEAAGNFLQGVHGRLGVVHGLQAVRPVHGRGDARLESVQQNDQTLPSTRLRGGRPCRARGSTRRSTGSASSPRRSRASRSATCAGGCRSCPASRCRPTRRPPPSPRAPPAQADRAMRCRRPARHAPSTTVWLSSMVSTVPPRRTTGRPLAGGGASGCGHRFLQGSRTAANARPYAGQRRPVPHPVVPAARVSRPRPGVLGSGESA